MKPLRYLKYVILVVFVILLPAFVTNSLGMGDPFFCKYICPQGVLEGALPLALANSGIRAALGHLFTFKFTILVLFLDLAYSFPGEMILGSDFFERQFRCSTVQKCRWLPTNGASMR